MRIRTTVATIAILLGCWLALATPALGRPAPIAHTRLVPADRSQRAPHSRLRAAMLRARSRRRFLLSRRRAWLLLYGRWTRVAVCEEGGWIGWSGPAFPDSLGITAANWYGNGGGTDLRPRTQIEVAQHLLRSVGMRGWIPDQGGCAAW